QGSVDAQVIVVDVAPAVLGVVVVVGGALTVGLVDLVPDAFFGGGLHDVFGLGVDAAPLNRGVHKDVEHVGPLPQDVVGAPAQNHAGVFIGQLLDDPALQDEHQVAQGQVGAHGVQAVQQ